MKTLLKLLGIVIIGTFLFILAQAFWQYSCGCLKAATQSAVKSPPPIPAFKWQNSGLVSLWFDDGWLTQYSTAYPIIEKEQMKGAISVATRFVEQPHYVTWKNLEDLQANGWEITAHSVSHNCDPQYYNDLIAKHELEGSKRIIESHGLRADQFVMPCGYSNADYVDLFGADKKSPIIKDAKKYFYSYRTTVSIRQNPLPVTDPYNLKAFQIRITTSLNDVKKELDQAKQDKTWLILVFHQIDSSGQPLSVTETHFQQIIDEVKKSRLPVVLPSQALAIGKKN